MDEPTKRNPIISGEATVAETDSSTISMRKVIVQDEKLTLDGLMESWNFSQERKEQCIVMCANYVAGPENFGRCLTLMEYVSQNDFSKENFPNIAPHLPAMFSLPVLNQNEIMTVLRKNLEAGDYFSAYKVVLETHEEAVRARVYSRLDQLGLHQEILDHQYIWENLNAAFFQYPF